MKPKNKFLSAVLAFSLVLPMTYGIGIADADGITVELDGTPLSFDVEPQMMDGRTMVPLRKIFEELGAMVKWDNDTQTVQARKSSKTVTLTVGSSELIIDKGETDLDGNPVSEVVTLDVPPQIVADRTLVPARAVSESFGLSVDWDDDTQTVILSSKNDTDDSWKENIGTINLSDLSYTGNGVEINDNLIRITEGGDFTVTGTLADGSITVSANEKVKLRLSDASVTAEEGPCILIENADKAYITLTENTENTLIAKNSESGAVYSKDNLEIKGKGVLHVTSSAHGIKASDNLTIENGTLNIDAASDGIHVNDTFQMSGGVLNITAVGDGIDSESIVKISDGTVAIRTTAVPASTSDADSAQDNPKRNMPQETATDVEFEKSSKGISAEWMLCITGGVININSASHGIHCRDEILIDGGTISISSEYEKGISAHGNLTVNGSSTQINITKSTEGIESKNILTVNDGVITVVASDDALNATGGSSGAEGMPNGNFAARPGDENRIQTEPPALPEGEPNGGEQGDRPHGRGEHAPFGDRNPSAETNTPPESFRPETDGFAPPSEDENGTMPTMPNAAMHGEPPVGNGRTMKDCLIINGGYLELSAGDDCLDSNGNLIINGGTVKAVNPTGSFAGAFAVIDPDGQTVIGENATLIFAAASGEERNLNLSQPTILVYCDTAHNANDTITVTDADGISVCDYTPAGTFRAVLISSDALTLGQIYTVTVGDESYQITLSEQTTIIGTRSGNNKGFGRER